MPKFKVINCPQQYVVTEMKRIRNPETGIVSHQMVERVVKAGDLGTNGEPWWPSAYGHSPIKPGDIIELKGRHADKAMNNQDFELVTEAEVTQEAVEPPKRRRGRPRKIAVDTGPND